MPPSTRPSGSARRSGRAGGAGGATVSIGVVDRSRRRMRRWLRRAWRPIAYLWRRSLMFRSVAITVMTTGLAVGIIGTAVMVSISTNVYSQRRDQIESESARATIVAQGIFDAATAGEDNNQSELETLQNEARQAILSNTTSPGGTSIAIERSPDQSTAQTLQTIASQGFPDAVITDALRKEVAQNTGRLSLQPVELDDDGRRVPGLAVGSTLQIPSAGQYELYLVYDLSDAQQTLDFVSQTLSIGGVALMVLIALVTSLVVRLVVVPIRGAAETSRKIAAGRLDERIPVRGQDDLATLARSFNGMAEAVSRQITQLAELSRVQQRFVSDVSHELRTPLTTIRLAGDMLYDSRHAFEPSVGRSAELLHTQVERFEMLLADLLEISRYDAQAVQLDTAPVVPASLAADIVDEFRPLAERAGVELQLATPGGHTTMRLDAKRVRRILRNLVGNAIEHGDAKPVQVVVDSDARTVAIAVRDQGVGMPPEDAARVFDRFWRADPSRKRTIGGTGLGLAISLGDAKLHGGRIDVWSRPGEGSTFVLTLPRNEQGTTATSAIPLPELDESYDGPRAVREES
ncbi:MtrAB system histidine kinase MtrB [Curtobacterium flaccumfaciens]|uniref:MtrAB system histidine kinase MtrB n=1 Tax=Curtobacterium flaccumfaciens TaxID=2035 RepID=UPI001BDE75D3|nr:MtrAB system histidine kinase MtrB [Curtobacterium flaccumfaciens]MBT1605177.1 HAMP domain-containing histidine kinase [Curtobacterium flaccumfaciens pv. betae]MBT1655719.1 HAMP domain-containing histidine kinase [Curtobacterium flaccumfaciens pv. betae]MCS0470603.1 MtrAB system histidine kinase MtrB [Curtobacterium flaccumfaciens pv. betae]MCS0474279.1 MtrAB system histidine kinase MtrB [Curtobacterium flaccumfaciens pv. betae]MCS0478528.1 MtrAB system histidine kinase MtrB [Curtobacterium